MLIINGKIHTIEDGVILNGYIRIKDGMIAEVGDMRDVKKDGCETLDAGGADVLPGFIDAHTHLGMWEDSLNFEGDDGNEDTDPATPHLRAIDGANPRDRAFEEALCAGVTTVMTGPGSANPIGGQMALLKTCGNVIDDMIIRAPAAMKFALGENPKTIYNGKNQSPSTRMATAAIIRENLLKTKDYIEAQKQAKQDEEYEDHVDFDFKCESLIPILEGKVPAHFHAHRSDDIFTAIRIANEFGLSYVLIHCTEGHLVADELKKRGARIISGPSLCDRSKPELKELSFKTPGELANAGLMVAITTDHPEIPIKYLPLCAILAVKEGMKKEEALKAITLNPARICGADDRIGSIRKGKEADIVIMSGDLFDLFSQVRYVVAGGKIVVKDGKKI